MRKKRLIARLDIKNEAVIKGVQLEGLRKVGKPSETAAKYYKDGIDEILFMDAVAAYYDRNSLSEILRKTSEDVFVPITVGGGLRSVTDMQVALNAGADKVAINSQAVREPTLLGEAVKVFGSQSVVSSIVAKKTGPSRWEVYIDNGREPAGKNVMEWAKQVEQLGAGELVVTSLDREGTKQGFDLDLYDALSSHITLPLIACGGGGTPSDIAELLSMSGVDAVAIASVLHYQIASIQEIRSDLALEGVRVRGL